MLPEAWLARGMEVSNKNSAKGGMKYSRVKMQRVIFREDSIRLGSAFSFQDPLAIGRAFSFQESIPKTVTQTKPNQELTSRRYRPSHIQKEFAAACGLYIDDRAPSVFGAHTLPCRYSPSDVRGVTMQTFLAALRPVDGAEENV